MHYNLLFSLIYFVKKRDQDHNLIKNDFLKSFEFQGISTIVSKLHRKSSGFTLGNLVKTYFDHMYFLQFSIRKLTVSFLSMVKFFIQKG